MPWNPADAKRHTKKAGSEKRQRQWAHVANSVLEDTGDEAAAVRAANSAVKKDRDHHAMHRASKKKHG